MYLLILLLLLLLIFNIKNTYIYFSILCITIIIFAINNTKLQENYKNKKCPKWEGKCYNRSDCGWCIDKNINGKCVKGKINGPKNKSKKKCSSWWYKGNCIYGKQCPYNRLYIRGKYYRRKDDNWEDVIYPEEECIELDEEDMVP